MDEINMLSSVIHTVIDASGLMLTDDFRISQKDGAANIVTSSDIAVQEFLCRRLSDLLPGCGFLCEEEDMHDLLHEYTWIIDPIDGTANYSRGIRECAICVGLKHGAVMELAVVYLPRTDELFAAQRGKGAFLHHPQSGRPSVPLHVSDRPFSDSIMCTLCYLAMGRCELYFEYLLSPWDFAAASLILEEAGGVLCNREGLPLDYTKPSGVLAGNSRENLNRLVSIVRDSKKV